MEPLLRVEGLTTQFFTSSAVVRAVDGVSFEVNRGETVGIVGESGSGKSVTALSVLRLVPDPGRIVSGRILFGEEGLRDVVQMLDEEIQDFRGNDVAMIFQDPMTSLNPVLRIGFQIREAVRRAVQDFGSRGCAAGVAQEYGDHPDTAVARMRWARRMVEDAFAPPGRLDAPRPRRHSPVQQAA